MKQILSIAVRHLLIALARVALALHKPTIIAITGSVGKTTTKDMITAVFLEAGYSVRGSRKSYNGEFGVPLSIFGLPTGNRNPFTWFGILLMAWYRTLFSMPRYVVLEVGLEAPGDIAEVVTWLKPDIAVLTRLPKTPVHLENFSDKGALYGEKVLLLRAVKPGGTVLYNGEDAIQKPYISQLPDSVTARAFTDTARVARSGIHYDEQHNPVGTDAVLSVSGVDEPFYIPDVLGAGAVQSLIVAVAVARTVDPAMPISVIRKAIASREPTPGRMRILPGRNGSVIIDDSYNASPVAMEEALRVLSIVEKKRKVAVLGVMAQLGPAEQEAHAMMGRRAAEVTEYVFTVGTVPYSTETRSFLTTEDAVRECLKYAEKGTVFLCKGSQIARIEKVVKGLLAPTVDPKDVLVRQEAEWLRDGGGSV